MTAHVLARPLGGFSDVQHHTSHLIDIFRLTSLILALPIFTGSWALVTEVPEHAALTPLYKALVEN